MTGSAVDSRNAGPARGERPWFASYAPGVPREITVPEGAVGAVLTGTAARYGRRVALDFYGATTTYADLLAEVERAAEALRRAGVRAGDRVAVVLPNCPQHVVAFYAVLRLGAVVVEHNPLASTGEIRAQFARHGARVAIAWEKSLPLLPTDRGLRVLAVDLTSGLPWTKRALLRLPIAKARTQRAAMRGPVPAGVDSWDRVVRRSPRLRAGHPYPGSGDLAVLLHTGGTTGVPKAVALTHRNLQVNCEQGRAWVVGLREGAETIYAVLPFFHAFGLTLCLTFAVRMAATSVLMPRFEAPAVLAAMKRRPATFFPGVPPMFDRIEQEAARTGADLTSIRFSIAGAMPLAREVADRWEKRTGGLIVEGYGMTESSPVALGSPLSAARRPGTLGIPFPSTDIRVVDPEHPDVDVPHGERGELLLRGPQVFGGYDRDPEETAHVLLPGGWLRTGDIVTMDDDGFVTVVDRIKELIISGGFNVYPSQVEATLREMPGVADVAVVGMPSVDLGEDVLAAIVPHPGVVIDLDAVREWSRERLARYAVPRQLEILRELPRSQLGKVLRRSVREHLVAQRAHLESLREQAAAVLPHPAGRAHPARPSAPEHGRTATSPITQPGSPPQETSEE